MTLRQAKACPPPVRLQREPGARAALRAQLAAWFQAQGRDLPWRRTEDPYAVMVSELMLQQTQVATVIPYFERWLARFPTIAALAAADEAEVLSTWQGLGYYARARNLHRAAQVVVAEHHGQMPRTVEALRRLPGAGRYTAGAIGSFAYDLPVAAVDANIARVLARLFCIRQAIDTTAGQTRLWDAAELLLPSAGGRAHNSALMELGALICIPRRPRCELCPVAELCAGREIASTLPVKKARRAPVPLEENCAWVHQADSILLEQQAGPRWKGLWKLPAWSGPLPPSVPLWQSIYPFTHHRVTLRVWKDSPPLWLPERHAWHPITTLPEVPLAAPHRRALQGLLRLAAARR